MITGAAGITSPLLEQVLGLSWVVPLAVAGDWRGEVVWPRSEAHGYKSYSARWHTLAIFVAQTFVNAFLWIGFAPVSVWTQRYYGVSVAAVNLLSVIFMVLYAPGSYIAMHMIAVSGLRRTMVVGVLLNATGSLVRLASVWAAISDAGVAGYAILLLGQALPALAQPFFTNIPAKLAGDWFPDSQRDVATVIGAFGNVLGNAAGQIIPPLLVTCRSKAATESSVSGLDSSGSSVGDMQATDKDCSSVDDVTGMEALLLIQAVLACLFTLWALFCFEGAPPSPPSRSAAKRWADHETQRSSESFSPKETIQKHAISLWANVEFRKLLIGFGVGLAVFNALLTVLGQLILPLYGVDDAHNQPQQSSKAALNATTLNAATSDAGLYGGVLIAAGLVGASIVGPVLDTTHAYRSALKGGFICATVSLVYMLVQLKPNNQTHLAVGFGLMGFSMMPLLPVALEAAVEATYPVPEEMSATLLMLVGNLGGLGLTYLLQYLISLEPVYRPHLVPLSPAGWFLLLSVGTSMVVVSSFKGEYRRLQAEQDAATWDGVHTGKRGMGLQERLSSSASETI